MGELESGTCEAWQQKKINKRRLIRPISVSQWGLSSRKFKLTLLSFKEKKKKKIRGEGKRKEKRWRCWKSERERGTAPAPPGQTRAGTYVPRALEQPASHRNAALGENAAFFVQPAEDNCSSLPFKVPGKASPATDFHV